MAYNHYILVCGGTGCESSDADGIYKNLISEAKTAGLLDKVQIVKTGCFGFCEKGPIVKVLPEDSFYVEVKPEDAKDIIAEQIVKGREVTRLLYNKEKKATESVGDIQFYQKQLRIVLRNCGVINPENIEEYIARDGYLALEKALFELTPQQIIDEVKLSGLRGRGGAGFPTGVKWEATMKTPGDVKYVVCNADEGDPGAYMDRSTIEGDPHSVIEAMTICGKAIGAREGFVYIRAEYPLAVDRLKIALQQARDNGLLGKNILGSGFDFDIEIRLGAGAFVCGEETALLRSIEGKRGMPTPKPPFPAQSGLWGKPTVINNVETYANVPVILTKGASWFNKIGTADSKGTKVFALTGKIQNSGLVEVPMGTTLREIIFEIGGGIKNGKKFKGVQTGGPSGGIITEESLDTPIDFGALTRLGSMMGSGGMIVMDEDDCVVDVSKFYMEFCVDESCGKCSPCRIGTRQIHGASRKNFPGTGRAGRSRPYPRDWFRDAEVVAVRARPNRAEPDALDDQKIRKRISRAHQRKEMRLRQMQIPRHLHRQRQVHRLRAHARANVPPTASRARKKCKHKIDQTKCLKCGECFKTCKFDAIDKC